MGNFHLVIASWPLRTGDRSRSARAWHLVLYLARGNRRVFTAVADEGMSESKANDGKNGATGKPLLYVVDDEPMLLELASVILEPLGYAVKTFRDPDSAIKSFNAANPAPALVITDYSMHAMNGMDLLRACRKVRPKQKILLISGTVGEEIFRNSPLKPDRFLTKPYHAKQLVEMVQSLLEK